MHNMSSAPYYDAACAREKRLRVRVMGLLLEKDTLLLIKHRGFGKKGYIWLPPGGEVEFGESMKDALKREFLEEVGIKIHVKHLITVHEFLSPPLHAVECLFYVHSSCSKDIRLAQHSSPEEAQILETWAWMSPKQLQELPKEVVYAPLRVVQNFSDWISRSVS